MMILPDTIVAATSAPREAVHAAWPLVYAALQKHKVASWRSQIGAIATITVEVPPWKPIREYASGEAYEGREDLGNTEPGDGVRYKGRGFIQLTGKSNYKAYGALIGVNLIQSPNRALEPEIAAEVFALYWKWKKVAAACDIPDWRKVRKLVNGGYNGWKHFAAIIDKLDVRDE
jgi:hypothetical protein